MSETGKPLHWVVQYCSMVKPYKGPFTWTDCLHWITIDKFNTKEEADAFMETEGEQHRHSFVGAALRVYPIYPSVTLNKYRGDSNPPRIEGRKYPYGCPYCRASYKSEFFLGQHISLLHPEKYDEWEKASEPGSNPGVFVEIRFLKETPIITGVDMKQYGPFKKGDVAALPEENARVLIKMKIAERRVKPPKEPTLKEIMKGEVLTGYIEAARTKPLVAEEMERLAIKRWRLCAKARGLLKEIREEKARIGV